MLKKIIYRLLDIITFGKGIKRTFEGNTIRMPTRYYRYFPKGYEKDNFLFINKHLRPGMTILDIGAHIGLMSIPFSKRTGPEGKVFAFEPTPTTVRVLEKTVKLNGGSNVSIEPYALSHKKGKLTFHISENEVDNSNSLVNNKRTDRMENAIEVDVSTIDDIVREKGLERIDFIKIDVEGAELQVLKGGDQTISKFRPPMILSIHPDSIKNFGDSQTEIWDYLKQHGYSIIVDGEEAERKKFSEKKELFEVFLT
jgi:FkbM family methyltransferase